MIVAMSIFPKSTDSPIKILNLLNKNINKND